MQKKVVSAFLTSVMILLTFHNVKAQFKEAIQMQQQITAQSGDWLEGYAETVSGELIDYHSTRDDCSVALITRATDGKMAIEWKTATVPADWKAEESIVHFLKVASPNDKYGRRIFRILNFTKA